MLPQSELGEAGSRLKYLLVLVLGLVSSAALIGTQVSKDSADDSRRLTQVTGAHPRLFLTGARIAALNARKSANTAEYQAFKSFADRAVPSDTINTTLTAPLGRGEAGTTFSVLDASGFPAAEQTIRINLEALRVTRSGNTFTVVERNHDIFGRGTSGAANHANGSTVWKHVAMADVVNGAPGVGLLMRLGAPGYEEKCRSATNLLLYFYSAPSVYNSNESRWSGLAASLAHDWCYDAFTTQERSLYGLLFRDILRYYTVTNPQFAPIGTQSLRETAISGNVGAGYLRTILAMSATSFGDNPDAQNHWNEGINWAMYLRSAMLGGAVHAGINAEGGEYSQTDWILYQDIFEIIASATGDPTALSQIAPWVSRFIKLLIHATVPGANNSTATTSCSTTARSVTLLCASTSTFAVGQDIHVPLNAAGNPVTNTPDLVVNQKDRALVRPMSFTATVSDIGKSVFTRISGTPSIWKWQIVGIEGTEWRLQRAIPASYGAPPVLVPATLEWSFGGRGFSPLSNHYHTAIVAIDGNTITVRDPAPGDMNNQAVSHRPTFRAFGDVEQNYNYDDVPFIGGETTIAVAHAQDILGDNVDRATAEYAEDLLDRVLPRHLDYQSMWWFLWRNAGLKAASYTALPLNYSSEDPDSMGLLFGRSSWSTDATWVSFIAGGSNGNHVQSYFGSYGIRRKGVYLTRDLTGYDIAPLSTGLYFNEFADSRHIENPYTGARTHNTIQMNRHGSVSNHTGAPPDIGASSLVRSFAGVGYLYGRMDASNMYRGDGMDWASIGYPNNDARTWVRDFIYVTPDLVAFQDRTTYANPTTSPTRWFFNTPCTPLFSQQTMTCIHSTQKLVQDILLPASAVISRINYPVDEDGALDGYRTEVVSGTRGSTEFGLNVLQVMDAQTSPATVKLLTTVNANVAQVGNSHVVAFVRDPAPVLNITYQYASTPTHYVVGLAPLTKYHVVNDKGTVTISTSTAENDLSSNAAGMLILSNSARLPGQAEAGTVSPSPPSGLRILAR